MIKFPLYHQYDQMDCGPTLRRDDSGGQACLRMIAKHHGRHLSMDTLRRKSGINREGVSLLVTHAVLPVMVLVIVNSSARKYTGVTKQTVHGVMESDRQNTKIV